MERSTEETKQIVGRKDSFRDKEWKRMRKAWTGTETEREEEQIMKAKENESKRG